LFVYSALTAQNSLPAESLEIEKNNKYNCQNGLENRAIWESHMIGPELMNLSKIRESRLWGQPHPIC
jgi:hypothetical protein